MPIIHRKNKNILRIYCVEYDRHSPQVRQEVPSTKPFLAAYLSPSAIAAQFFTEIDLVTDDQLIKPALQTDPNLKNPWGISFGPGGPFWVSDNGTGVTTLYGVDPTTNATAIVPLVVSIPGNGTTTGQVFNGTTNFNATGESMLLTLLIKLLRGNC